jgi:hypothetical protein
MRRSARMRRIPSARAPAHATAVDELSRVLMPQPLTVLLGRDMDVNALRYWLADPAGRLITLVGPGGVGKSRLALERAREFWTRASPDDCQALSRRPHGLMHVVNTVARQHFGGVMTGVQLGPERSRIDFKLAEFTREQLPDFEARVNEVIDRGLTVTPSVIGEEEYRRRPELIRTLKVLPPVVEGRVRIITIEGFDAQACGATHVHSTSEIGRTRLGKFDNKGKDHKRFYWDLTV